MLLIVYYTLLLVLNIKIDVDDIIHKNVQCQQCSNSCILILCTTVVGVHFQFLKRAGNHLSTIQTLYTFESAVLLFAGSRANVADLFLD